MRPAGEGLELDDLERPCVDDRLEVARELSEPDAGLERLEQPRVRHHPGAQSAVEQRDARVRALGLAGCGVGIGQQGVGIDRRPRRPRRDTDVEHGWGVLRPAAAEPVADPSAQLDEALVVARTRYDDDELVTADARDDALAVDDRTQVIGDLDEDGITPRVPVAVVRLLEAVHVAVHEPDAGALDVRLLEHAPELFVERVPVGQVGQRVRRGRRSEPRRQLLAFCDRRDDEREVHQEHPLARRHRAPVGRVELSDEAMTRERAQGALDRRVAEDDPALVARADEQRLGVRQEPGGVRDACGRVAHEVLGPRGALGATEAVQGEHLEPDPQRQRPERRQQRGLRPRVDEVTRDEGHDGHGGRGEQQETDAGDPRAAGGHRDVGDDDGDREQQRSVERAGHPVRGSWHATDDQLGAEPESGTQREDRGCGCDVGADAWTGRVRPGRGECHDDDAGGELSAGEHQARTQRSGRCEDQRPARGEHQREERRPGQGPRGASDPELAAPPHPLEHAESTDEPSSQELQRGRPHRQGPVHYPPHRPGAGRR